MIIRTSLKILAVFSLGIALFAASGCGVVHEQVVGYKIRRQYDSAEPVNNFWTLIVKNYCSIFLSPNASAGGLIHAAPGKAGGNGTPLTNRSG